MIEALHSSETSVLARTTWRNIPEDGIIHSHRQKPEILKLLKNLHPCSVPVMSAQSIHLRTRKNCTIVCHSFMERDIQQFYEELSSH
jgi:hypothetical protein